MKAHVSKLKTTSVCVAVTLLCFAQGCSDEPETSGSATTTGGSGGAGGAASTGGVTSSGGAGGSGGCLPESMTSALFTLAATDLCAIAVYTRGAEINYQQPTWGAHEGPLLVTQGPADGQVTLDRWTAPAGASGDFTIASSTIDAQIPAGVFVGGEALDLRFRAGTALSYSGAFPDTNGELVIADGSSTSERYPVNALFSMAVLPANGAVAGGRVVYSGASPLGDAALGANGLYAADECAGALLPGGDPGCAAPSLIAAWGDASGPVVADAKGNVFVVMTSFAGDQTARGFASDKIFEGSPPTEGDELFTLPGFGQSLAAIAPDGDAPGIVAFQPSDPSTFEALDVLQIRYSVKNGTITKEGEPTPLLTFPAPNTATAMLTDPEGRLWVGLPVHEGDTTTTTFVVLARKP